MIRITNKVSLDEREIQEQFVRASGPGGQHVNKVSTAVQLRFDVRNSASLPEEVKTRLLSIAANRITRDGILIIDARDHRSQERNRQAAKDRLIDLIRQACRRPSVRKKTRPSRAVRKKRLEAKRKRSATKRLRGKVRQDSD